MNLLKYIFSDDKINLNWFGVVREFFLVLHGTGFSLYFRRPIFLASRENIEGTKYFLGSGILKIENGALIQGMSSYGVTLGRRVSLGAFSQLRPSSQYGGLVGEGCSIGNGSTFGPYTYIGCAGFIEIDSSCMFGPRVSLIAENHVIPDKGLLLKDAGVTRLGIRIGNDCWVGANTVILDGVCIGNGSIIGAGAVVRGRIPPNSIAVGVPARVVKGR